jgi:hypothetical protein
MRVMWCARGNGLRRQTGEADSISFPDTERVGKAQESLQRKVPQRGLRKLNAKSPLPSAVPAFSGRKRRWFRLKLRWRRRPAR